MARSSPLLPLLQPADPLLEQYGPAEAGSAPILIVQTFGVVDIEYAALRKSAGVLDEPHRATLSVKGADRLAFLNRMLTQELKDAIPGVMRRSFWLSRKGRIEADLRVLVLNDQILLDLDAHAAPRTLASLGAFIIADDVALSDESEAWHRLSVHGPRAQAVVGIDVEPSRVENATIGNANVLVTRDDTVAAPGLHLFLKTSDAPQVYRAILAAGAKPIGWAAWNIARIEAGTPIYPLDFAHDALPAETGLLHQRVSFTKGCYLGQEIVARMNALGHPKQVVVGVRLDPAPRAVRVAADDPTHDAPDAACIPQPEGGAVVFADTDGAASETEIGRVSSSAVSPLLGNRALALASLRWGHHTPGTRVQVEVEGGRAPGVVCALDQMRAPGP